MSDSCNTCGKTSSLMNCKRCKSVAYCSAECQRRDWKTHKPTCRRKELAGAPCDRCGCTDDVECGDVCLECGFLFCHVCKEQYLTRDLSGQILNLEPCPRCQQRRDFRRRARDCKKLEKLIKESPRDPRLAIWLVGLGEFVAHFDNTRRGEQKAKDHFLRAGELGLGEGFTRVGDIYLEHQNWDEARRYYRKGANLMDVIAIANLAVESALGYFHVGEIKQEDHRRPPDLEEAFRLSREGARLGHAECCGALGHCYLRGQGTEENHTKGFKWSRESAEKGHAKGMLQCADCYLFGDGVEQSDEQAIYWYEKSLELEDNEDIRRNLQILLRGRSAGSS